MSDFKNVMKGGWHPKGKDGGKESWRGDFKGINQVAGWMGKGKKPGQADEGEHISRPLASLKDPSSFGPPPKHVNYHGGAALPNAITPHKSGIGAPMSQEEIDAANRAVNGPTEEEIEEEEKPKGPPLPYRADTTGYQTKHFAPPPKHRDLLPPPESDDIVAAPKPKPAPPPRLPARQNTTELQPSSSPPPAAYEKTVPPAPPPSRAIPTPSQSAMNRLGQAGVSVPALGIGNKSTTPTNYSTTNQETNPWKTERSQQPTTATSTNPQPQTSQPANINLSELQNRFSRMSAATKTPPVQSPTNEYPSQTDPSYTQPQPNQQQTTAPQGTTWAQKQAALRTASNLHQNPSSVTVADARSAAGTANNFRERHGDTIAAAGTKASAWNKRYNVTGKVNSFLEKHASPTSENPPPLQSGQQQQQQQQTNQISHESNNSNSNPSSPIPNSEFAASISRKPPPPPPPKKPVGMHGNSTVPPPPVPLGTKPSYT